MYDADVSATLISKVTDSVIDRITEWQARPLDPIYAIVYLDCIVIKIRKPPAKPPGLVGGFPVVGQQFADAAWLSGQSIHHVGQVFQRV
jgi:putative transposase